MVPPTESTPIIDVPTQVFESFLKNAKDAGVSDELLSRLKKTLLEEQLLNETALKAALFGEETMS